MERIRLAALYQNDATMQPPILGDVGMYVWKIKEVVAPEADIPEWGAVDERGIAWEAVTATAMILAGTNLLIMRHPRAIETAEKTIDELV
jgi:acetyl-CoA decarbonylase/synthase complex subunit delta